MQFQLGRARRSTTGRARRSRPRPDAGARVTVTATILLGLSLTGCFGDDGDAVFAGSDATSALLVQWADDGNGRLTGSVQIADKSLSADGAPVKQTTFTFSGKRDSNQVFLVVQADVGPDQNWRGSLDGDDLRVDVPRGGRRADTITLARGSADEFNADVALLEKAVIKARTEAAKVAAEQKRVADIAAQAARNQELFDNAVIAVATSRETVAALMPAPPELKDLPGDVKDARQNLAVVNRNVGEAAERARGFVACEFASQAQNAAAEVSGDAARLQGDARAVAEASDDLADAYNELTRAYATLQQLSNRDGRSSKSATPSLQAVIEKARGTATSWRKAAKKAQKEMKSIVSESDNLADNARRASC